MAATRTHFTFRIDMWIADGESIVERIARRGGLLGWSQTELANRAGLSLPTVKRVKTGTASRVSDEARTRIQKAPEAGGAQFISENGGGPGVRLRKTQQRGKRK